MSSVTESDGVFFWDGICKKEDPTEASGVLAKSLVIFLPPFVSQQYLHNGATLGLVLVECGGEQLCLAGKV